MLANPHPSELLDLLEPGRSVEENRSIFCEHYDLCLTEAVNRRWTSWTCACCPMFCCRQRESEFRPRTSCAPGDCLRKTCTIPISTGSMLVSSQP